MEKRTKIISDQFDESELQKAINESGITHAQRTYLMYVFCHLLSLDPVKVGVQLIKNGFEMEARNKISE